MDWHNLYHTYDRNIESFTCHFSQSSPDIPCIFNFYAPKIKDQGHIVFVLSLWNFNLANNFWTVSAKAFIFHMNIPCNKTFPLVPLLLTLWSWPCSLTHLKKKIFNLVNIFWTVSARALIFHMNIPCDTCKTFPWGSLFFTLWPLPCSLTHFLKTLTLPIPFQQWVLELWYVTWIFPVIRYFRGYHYFLHCDLDLGGSCPFPWGS